MTGTKPVEEVFCRIRDLDTMRAFFREIFTKGERKDVELRWKLMGMLMDGVPQRKIASELGISLCKITRGAKVLKAKDSVSRRMLEQGTSRRKQDE